MILKFLDITDARSNMAINEEQAKAVCDFAKKHIKKGFQICMFAATAENQEALPLLLQLPVFILKADHTDL